MTMNENMYIFVAVRFVCFQRLTQRPVNTAENAVICHTALVANV